MNFLSSLCDFGKICLPHPYTTAHLIFLVHWQFFPNFSRRGLMRKRSHFAHIFGWINIIRPSANPPPPLFLFLFNFRFFRQACLFIHSFIYLLIYLLIDRSIDWLIDWLIDFRWWSWAVLSSLLFLCLETFSEPHYNKWSRQGLGRVWIPLLPECKLCQS